MSTIENLPKKYQKKLLTEIIRICEKQFRRGYQQGVYHALDGKATKDDADKLRAIGIKQNYLEIKLPPELRIEENQIEKLHGEIIGMDHMDILKQLISLINDE